MSPGLSPSASARPAARLQESPSASPNFAVYEVSQRFYFDAAHTLDRKIDSEASRRIHGHTYQAEVTIRGPRDPSTGMVLDLGHLRQRIERVRADLDHAFLDDVSGLGAPTLENLCAYIAERLQAVSPPLACVRVWRDATGDACCLRLYSE